MHRALKHKKTHTMVIAAEDGITPAGAVARGMARQPEPTAVPARMATDAAKCLKASAGFSSSSRASPEEEAHRDDDGLDETAATSEDDIEAISMSPRVLPVSAITSGGGGSFISIFFPPSSAASVNFCVRILYEKYASECMHA